MLRISTYKVIQIRQKRRLTPLSRGNLNLILSEIGYEWTQYYISTGHCCHRYKRYDTGDRTEELVVKRVAYSSS